MWNTQLLYREYNFYSLIEKSERPEYIEKLTEFKKRGDVANYVGKESPHEVKPVTEGTRTVLVAWYSDIKGKLI